MSPADIIPKLLIVPAILVGGMVIAIIVKLFWLKFVVPKLQMAARQRQIAAEMAKRKRKGEEGERKVAEALSVFTEAEGYHLRRDVRIPDGEGGITQIDIVLFSPYGIFVVEVKNWSGEFHVDPGDRMWTRHSGVGEKNVESPRRQNDWHIAALQKLTGLPKERFHSLVVMAGDAIIKSDKELPPGVVYLHEVRDEVREKTNPHKEGIWSDDEVTNAIANVEKHMTHGG